MGVLSPADRSLSAPSAIIMIYSVTTSANPYLKPAQPWPGLAPFSRRVVLPDGLSLHVYDSKPGELPAAGRDAQAVLLVHGLGDDADTWRYLFEPLSRRRRVIALDLPGFARSDPAPGAYNLPFFKDTLVRLMDAMLLTQATLIGHSLGALLSQVLAFEQPSRVRRLVLLSGSVVARFQKINRELLLYLLPVIGERQYNRLRRSPQKAYETLRPYYASLDALPEGERSFLFERVNQRVWSDTQRAAFLSTLRSLARWAPAQRRFLEDRLAHSNTPTLLVWGDQDAINSLDNGRYAAQIQPDIKLVVLRQAGHNLQHEQPVSLIQSIQEFEHTEEQYGSTSRQS
jgi:pimeloyl-ACP methyl ester carboxylesterase